MCTTLQLLGAKDFHGQKITSPAPQNSGNSAIMSSDAVPRDIEVMIYSALLWLNMNSAMYVYNIPTVKSLRLIVLVPYIYS